MILQYKGFNNLWCYEEANVISWATVWVGKETRDYRKGGVRYNHHKEKQYNSKQEEEISDLNYAKEMHDAVDKLINDETHCCVDELIYNINTPFDQMENVQVVILESKNRRIARVFDKGVYLLNSNGKTVQRIA